MGINENGHNPNTMQLPVKQRVTVALFDGEAKYKTTLGEMSAKGIQEYISNGGMKHDLGPVALSGKSQIHCESQGFHEAVANLYLEPVNLKYVERTHNVITQLGLNAMADKIIGGTATTLPLGMELGSSTQAASLGDTGRVSTIIAAGFQTWALTFPSVSTSTASWKAEWGAGEAQVPSITEVVMVTAASAANAISRIVFTAIDKSGANDTLAITINWAMSEA